jgi:membrane fusion protein
VLDSKVSEGQVVRAGDVLFVLEVGPGSQGGDTHAAVREGLGERRRQLETASERQLQIDQARRATLEGQIGAMRREAAQLDGEIALLQQRLRLAEAAQARLESLRGENFVSPAQVQAKAEELLGLQASMQALQRQAASQQRQVAALEAERRELPLRTQAQRDEIDRELAALAQQAAENEARQQLVIRAPHDGMVGGVLAQPGQAVRGGAPLATLLPAHAQLQAHLYAPSSAIGFVREQQPVHLRYQAFPYQKFGHQPGRVIQVSRAPLPASDSAVAGVPASEAMYRITVALPAQTIDAYGTAQPLAPGMQLEADVLLDRRRLIEWIFEPVLGLSGRV